MLSAAVQSCGYDKTFISFLSIQLTALVPLKSACGQNPDAAPWWPNKECLEGGLRQQHLWLNSISVFQTLKESFSHEIETVGNDFTLKKTIIKTSLFAACLLNQKAHILSSFFLCHVGQHKNWCHIVKYLNISSCKRNWENPELVSKREKFEIHSLLFTKGEQAVLLLVRQQKKAFSI